MDQFFYVKSSEEIERISFSASLVAQTLKYLKGHLKPGITGLDLDALAEEYILDHGADPGFLGYHGFPSTVCISINNFILHGIPKREKIRNGDIVSLDLGVIKDGYFGDAAQTFVVGQSTVRNLKLVVVTKAALDLAVKEAYAGNDIINIGRVIENHITSNGFHVIREYGGHGIGKDLHEAPFILNYPKESNSFILKKNMCICIEPIASIRPPIINVREDKWTVHLQDDNIGAHFEHTVLVGETSGIVLSK